MPVVWSDGVFEIEVDVAGTIECQGGEWEVGITRANNNQIFQVFRSVAQPDSYFFLAKRSWDGGVKVHIEPALTPEQPSLPLWRESLRLSLELGAWGRALWFDGQGRNCSRFLQANWVLFALPDGRSAWMQVPLIWFIGWGFDTFPLDHAADAPHVQEASTTDWIEWVNQSLSASTDCQFAFSFARLSHEEKMNFAVEWRSGYFQKFLHLCRCIGWLCIDWEEQSLLVRIDLNEPEYEYMYMTNDRGRPFAAIPGIDKAEKIWTWAVGVSKPEIRASLLERKSVATWLKHYGFYTEFQVSEPNAHELIEAKVSLQQWAREMGVEEELQQMLNGSDS